MSSRRLPRLGGSLIVLAMGGGGSVEATRTAVLLPFQPGEAPGFALLLSAALLGTWVAWRASPVLPAPAIERPLGLRRA